MLPLNICFQTSFSPFSLFPTNNPYNTGKFLVSVETADYRHDGNIFLYDTTVSQFKEGR